MAINQSPYLPWSGATPLALPANNPLLTFVEAEGARACTGAGRREPPSAAQLVGRVADQARRGEALAAAGSAEVARKATLIGGAAILVVADAAAEAHRAGTGSFFERVAAYPGAFEQSLHRIFQRDLRSALHISAATGIPSAAATLGAVAGGVTLGPAAAALLANIELAQGARRFFRR